MIAVLKEYHLVHGLLGLTHTLFALAAMALATFVLLGAKGTRLLDMRYFWWAVVATSAGTAAIGAYFIKREAEKMGFGEKQDEAREAGSP